MKTITIAEAARRLNLSRAKIRQFIEGGMIATIEPPDMYPRIEPAELERFYATWKRSKGEAENREPR